MSVNMICVLASIFVELLVTTQFGPVSAQQGSISVSAPASNPFEVAAGMATQIASGVAAKTVQAGSSIGFGAFDKMKSMQQGSSGGSPFDVAAGMASGVAAKAAQAGANMGSVGFGSFGVADKMKSMQQGSMRFPSGNPIAAVAGIATQIGSDMATKVTQTGGEIAQVAANAGSRGFDLGKKMMDAAGFGAGLAATSISGQFTMDQPSPDYNAMPLAQDRGQTGINRPKAPITITGNIGHLLNFAAKMIPILFKNATLKE